MGRVSIRPTYIEPLILLIGLFLDLGKRYHSGTLDLGYVNVTEGQLSVIATYLISGIFGTFFPLLWT